MRTTLNLDDELVRTVKQRAAQTGRTMTEMMDLALRELLNKESAPPRKFKLRWVTVRGVGQPRVDVIDRDALLDYMEAGIDRG